MAQERTFEAIYNEQLSNASLEAALHRIRAETISSMETQLREKRVQLARQIRATRARARSLGRRDGLANGQAQILSEVLRLHLLRQKIIADANHDCLELILKLLRKLLGEELRTSSSAIASRVTEAIQSLRCTTSLTVYLHSEQYSELSKRLADVCSGKNVVFKQLDSLPYGGARIESSFGSVELCWERALEVIEEGLREKLCNAIQKQALSSTSAQQRL